MTDFLFSIIRFQAAEIIVAQETIRKQAELIEETANVVREFADFAEELLPDTGLPTQQ